MRILAKEHEEEDLIMSLPAQLQDIPHDEGNCIRIAAICPQTVYTREEALRKVTPSSCLYCCKC